MKKEQQSNLFPEPELFYSSKLESQDRTALEDTALEASSHPLLFGEDTFSTPERRLTGIRGYMDREHGSVECYVIKYGNQPIGSTYIWDGWLALSGEYVAPRVELAFLDPKYKEFESLIKRKIDDVLVKVCENQGW